MMTTRPALATRSMHTTRRFRGHVLQPSLLCHGPSSSHPWPPHSPPFLLLPTLGPRPQLQQLQTARRTETPNLLRARRVLLFHPNHGRPALARPSPRSGLFSGTTPRVSL